MSIEETGKYVDRKAAERAESQKESEKQAVRKEGKSPFDELLEQSKMLQQNTLNAKQSQQTLTRQAVRESEEKKERQREETKDHDRESDDKQNSQDKRSGPSHDEMAGKRVVGKSNAREQQGGDGGGGSGESHQKGSGRQTKGMERSKADVANQPTPHRAEGKFAAALIQKQTAAGAQPNRISQEVLEKLVRYVRVGLNREGEKEVQLDLHENVFRGLRLLLAQKNGKVRIHFMTADAKGKALFSQNVGAIREALGAKGIAVDTIQVT